jgi:hypothetical protein
MKRRLQDALRAVDMRRVMLYPNLERRILSAPGEKARKAGPLWEK